MIYSHLRSKNWKNPRDKWFLFLTSFCTVQSYSAQETSILNVHKYHTHSSTKNSALRALHLEDSGPSGPQRNASQLKPFTQFSKCWQILEKAKGDLFSPSVKKTDMKSALAEKQISACKRKWNTSVSNFLNMVTYKDLNPQSDKLSVLNQNTFSSNRRWLTFKEP